MFRKIFSMVVVIVFIIPNFQAFAFTNVENSTKFNEEIVTSELENLHFNGNLKQESNLELINSTILTSNKIVGTFTTALSNDIANGMYMDEQKQSETYSLSVQVSKTTEDPIHQENKPSANTEEGETTRQYPNLEITPSNALHITIFILIFLIIVAISVVYLARKK